jgi:hypothetical protein
MHIIKRKQVFITFVNVTFLMTQLCGVGSEGVGSDAKSLALRLA